MCIKSDAWPSAWCRSAVSLFPEGPGALPLIASVPVPEVGLSPPALAQQFVSSLYICKSGGRESLWVLKLDILWAHLPGAGLKGWGD